MTARIVVGRAAAADISEAHAWCESQRVGLGGEFLDEVEASLQRIVNNPEHYPFVFRDARRVLVRRFPYAIYFRTRADEARIVAVIHQSRDPRLWQRRV